MMDSTQQRGDGASRDLVLLGAFCLFLSALEHLIPKPLPFMRLGLANLPLLLALDIFSVKHFYLLVLIKVLGQGLVTGTLFSYVALFSFAGTVLSASVMLILRRIVKKNSLIGVSIAGAFVSNAAQLVLARFIVFGEGVVILAPPFLAAGIISGGLFGFFADKFSAQSRWVSIRREGASAAAAAGTADTAGLSVATIPSSGIWNRTFSLLRGAALILTIGYFLIESRLYVRAALFALFWFLAMITGKKTRPLFTLISIVMIVLCNVFPPYGRIVFSFGSFIITEENILRGLQRAVTLEGLVMFSMVAIGSDFPLPGTIGRLLRETFAVLESLNSKFYFKGKKENLFQKLDRLLCEASGY
jgi:heptaprenyl diphosphate synthase